MIKRFLIAIVLLAAVCGGIVYFNMFRDQMIENMFANMPRPSVTVSTQEVEPISWTPGIEAIGTVSAIRGVDLAVETTGIVKDIAFSANDKVEDGQVLVQLDDAVEKADLEAQKATASLAKTALDRALELQRKGVGSDVTVDAASAAAATATANVARLQAVLDQKQLKAPFGGTVGIPRIEVGQYLAPGTVVATLQDLDTMRADFAVPEQQLDLLRIGQPVVLGVDQATWPFHGEITGIDPKVDASTRLVSVRSTVTDPDGRLSPGQFVQVRVQLPEENGIIAVVQTAVVTSLYGDYVYVVREAGAAETPPEPAPEQQTSQAAVGAAIAQEAPQPEAPKLEARQVFVKTGRRNEGLVEILTGLKAGDIVVTAGQNRLTTGAPVVIDNTITPVKQASAQ
jgi:membrane fusion protein (multidrug efflux system)